MIVDRIFEPHIFVLGLGAAILLLCVFIGTHGENVQSKKTLTHKQKLGEDEITTGLAVESIANLISTITTDKKYMEYDLFKKRYPKLTGWIEINGWTYSKENDQNQPE